MANVVAIVGRPNVGKSTLFNRLIEERKAIMDNESGVTRDRHYARAEWIGKFFTVIDTGGYVFGSDDVFEGAIREQVEMAIEEANVVLFMVDIMEGLTDLDKEFADVLRRYKKPVLIVANKSDTPEKTHFTGEFYSLGLGEIYAISSQTGLGTGELLDEVCRFLTDEPESEDTLPKFAIIGRPNVGKSSFLNALLNKERSIVTDIAGTTRDAIHSHYNAYGFDFMLIDTAGLRKKAKIKHNIEFYSILRSLRVVEESDVCVVLLDASQGIESQDVNIINLAIRYNKGVVIMVNKWDLVADKDSNTAREYTAAIRKRLAPNDFIPVIFSSVHQKQRIFQVLEKAVKVFENKKKSIKTSELNAAMLPEIEHYPPPSHKGKYIKIKYMTQVPAQIPTFLFFCNLPQYIEVSYERYLENKMRQHFDFEGVPIRLFFRQK